MRTVALLPMKAHSERIKGKNLKVLGGKPLFAWMLDTLQEMDNVDSIVINTDAVGAIEKEIPSLPGKIILRDREPKLCGDLVSMNQIIENDIAAVPAERYLMTHTTNPFLSATTINSALVGLVAESTDYDSLFSVNRIQARFYRSDGTAINHDPTDLKRTQDLELWFEENSCLYIFSAASFAATNARIGLRPMLFETPPLESVDIDEPHDWELAECLAKTMFKCKS